MRRFFLWILTAALAVQASAQHAGPKKYGELINVSDAYKHLSILASDEFEGRETGTRGAMKAANYIAGEFEKTGLKAPVNNSYFQPVPLVEKKIEVNSFQVNHVPFQYAEDFYFSGETGASVHVNEIVFAGYGISSNAYDDLKDVDVQGKVVLVINQGEPVTKGISAITKSAKPSEWSLNNAMRIENLQRHKPALILAVNSNVPEILKKYSKYFTEGRMTIREEEKDQTHPASVINITPAIADQLLKRSGKKLKALQAEINDTGKPNSKSVNADFTFSYQVKSREVNASNVLGYLEGGDLKDELLVISAHYDHVGLNPGGVDTVYNGADDDASGTTAVIELARVFAQAKKDGNGPRRSILFLGNTAEEKGLLGSLWYTDNPVFPLPKTITNLNIDMIGRVDSAHLQSPDYCYLIGSDKLSTALHRISEKANAEYTNLILDYKYNADDDPERIYYRSDHYNFAKHNIPIIFYFNGVHEDYHQPGDEIDKINFDLLVKRTKLIFYTAWELVNRDERPAVDVR